MEWYYVWRPWLTAKRVSWASCCYRASASASMRKVILSWHFCLSVCLPVRYRYCVESIVYAGIGLFGPFGRGITLVMSSTAITKFKGNTLSIHKGENMHFATEVAVYFGNVTRWVHDYYGSLTGSHGYPTDHGVGSGHLKWPWKARREGPNFSSGSPWVSSFCLNWNDQVWRIWRWTSF